MKIDCNLKYTDNFKLPSNYLIVGDNITLKKKFDDYNKNGINFCPNGLNIIRSISENNYFMFFSYEHQIDPKITKHYLKISKKITITKTPGFNGELNCLIWKKWLKQNNYSGEIEVETVEVY